jgi:hypothetical protein
VTCDADVDADADADADAMPRHANATSNRVSFELRSLSPQLLGGRASQTGPLL